METKEELVGTATNASPCHSSKPTNDSAILHVGGCTIELCRSGSITWLAFPTRQKAEAALSAIEEMLTDTKPLTVKEFSDRWVKYHVLAVIGPGSRRTYLRHIKKLVEHLGDKRLKDVTARDIKAFIALERKAGKKDREIRSTLSHWSPMFSTAVKWQYISSNPLAQLDVLLFGAKP